MQQRDRFLAVMGLVLLFAICQIVELPRARNLRGDETFYIQGAYRMLESGDFMAPRYESGKLRFEKPILTYWLVVGAVKVFGFGLAAARVPSVLLALASLPFVYGLGRVLLPRVRGAALCAVAVHVSVERVYSNAHQARTDMPLAFFVLVAMYFFARLIFTPGHERRDALLAYAATAGAVLTKGLAGFGFILLPVAVFLAISWRRVGAARWRAVVSPWGLAVLVLLTAPWFGLIVMRHGRAFADTFLGDQVGGRVTGAKWYLLLNLIEYPWMLFVSCLPWSLLVVLALATRAVPLRSALREGQAEWTFLLTWVAAMLLIFLPANITRGRYLLPAIPAFSLFAGLLLARLGEVGGRPRGLIWGLYVLALGAMLMAIACVGEVVALIPLGLAAGYVHPLPVVALIGGGVAMLLLIRRSLVQEAAFCAGAVLMIWMLSISTFFTPRAPSETTAELVQAALRSPARDAQIATVGLSKTERAVVLLYSGQPVTEWTQSDKLSDQVRFLRNVLRAPGPKFVLLDHKVYSALPAELTREFRLVASRSGMGKANLGAWLRKEPRTLRGLIEASQITLDLVSRRPAAAAEGTTSVGPSPPQSRK